MGEEMIGEITHYFSKAGVAVIKLDKGPLRVGDTIHVTGHTTDFTQVIKSMEIDNQKVDEVNPGDSFGIKIDNKVREHDVVHKVTEE